MGTVINAREEYSMKLVGKPTIALEWIYDLDLNKLYSFERDFLEFNDDIFEKGDVLEEDTAMASWSSAVSENRPENVSDLIRTSWK